jgi:integrase
MAKKRRGLSDKQVAELPRREQRYVVSDPEQRGLFLRVPPQGPIAFAAVGRNPDGKQVWATLGSTDEIDIEEARARARCARAKIKAGAPLVAPSTTAPAPDSVATVAQNWLTRVVLKNGYRTAAESERIVKKYIGEHLGERSFVGLKRSEISSWLDKLEDDHGTRTADRALATLRAIANWYAKRDDDYVTPFVRGMKRGSSNGRERILSDLEIKNFWKATETSGPTGDCLRLALLTAQRKSKLLDMRWSDVGLDGVWSIRTEAREKSNAGQLKLPELALALIRKQTRLNSGDHVFPFKDTVLDLASAAVSNGSKWCVHDLRRTARSLMSRAGVTGEIGELVLGHALVGVRATYDRFSYDAEKAEALQKLVDVVEQIVFSSNSK